MSDKDHRRALSERDAVIAQAERTRTRCLEHFEELATAGAETSAAQQATLRETEDRPVRLRESRAVLMTGVLAPSRITDDG